MDIHGPQRMSLILFMANLDPFPLMPIITCKCKISRFTNTVWWANCHYISIPKPCSPVDEPLEISTVYGVLVPHWCFSTTLKLIYRLWTFNLTIVLADILTNPDYSAAPQRMNPKEFGQNMFFFFFFKKAHNSWNINCSNLNYLGTLLWNLFIAVMLPRG